MVTRGFPMTASSASEPSPSPSLGAGEERGEREEWERAFHVGTLPRFETHGRVA